MVVARLAGEVQGMTVGSVTILSRVTAFVDAWQRGDVDGLMTQVADDCVYSTTTGPDPGTTYFGHKDVRRGFELVLAEDKALTVSYGAPVVCESIGLVEWVLHRRDGSVAARGCDVLEFADDLIKRKDAYRKVFG
jgi:ketosteroid isomerase-like protein